MTTSLQAISLAVCKGDQHLTAQLVEQAIAEGCPAQEVLSEGLISGMQALGAMFKDGEAFLPEILVSCRAMKMGLDKLRPHLVEGTIKGKGQVVLGTVAGDLHDIGKNLVGMLLEGSGFSVIDLGVDVPAGNFVEAARQHNADIVALSALLTTTTPQFRTVITALDDAGLRRTVKVLIGGAPVTQALANEIGADGFAADCVSAVEEAERLTP